MAYEYTQFMPKHPLPESRQERFRAVCSARFQRIPALAAKGFHFGFHEGYKEHSFGLRVGPVIAISGVIHDLAHVIEFGEGQFRLRVTGAGSLYFKVPRKWVYNRYCIEPKTGQASLREARTFGIQFRLSQMLGLRVDWDEAARNMVTCMKWVPDWYIHADCKKPLLKAMYRGYCEATEEVIDKRLRAWFASAHRSRARLLKDGAI